MNTDFDINKWNSIQMDLKRKYPQLTNADLMWRHETKEDFFKILAVKLKLTRKELEKMIASL